MRETVAVLGVRSLAYAGLGLLALATGSARAQPPDAVFKPLPPCRVVDSRINLGTSGVLLPGQVRSIVFRGICGIPGLTTDGGREANQARALALNVIAVNPGGDGHLTAWPSNQSPPPSSILNYTSIQNIANGVIVPMCDAHKSGPCPTGDINFQAAVSPVHLVVDVTGYYEKPILAGTIRIGASTAGGLGDGFLCLNNTTHMRYGLSTRVADYFNAPLLCTAGTWLCTWEERGLGTQTPCDTVRSDTGCDAIDCAGNCIDLPTTNHLGWVVDDNVPLNLGRLINEEGSTSTVLSCELRPAWCCSRDD